MKRLLRLLAFAACTASATGVPPHPPRNASDCPALRTEHVHRFEHACLHGGAEPPHTGSLLCCAAAHILHLLADTSDRPVRRRPRTAPPDARHV